MCCNFSCRCFLLEVILCHIASEYICMWFTLTLQSKNCIFFFIQLHCKVKSTQGFNILCISNIAGNSFLLNSGVHSRDITVH